MFGQINMNARFIHHPCDVAPPSPPSPPVALVPLLWALGLSWADGQLIFRPQQQHHHQFASGFRFVCTHARKRAFDLSPIMRYRIATTHRCINYIHDSGERVCLCTCAAPKSGPVRAMIE